MTDTPTMMDAFRDLSFWITAERDKIPPDMVGTIFFCTLVTTLVLDHADKGDAFCKGLVHKVACDMLETRLAAKGQRNG